MKTGTTCPVCPILILLFAFLLSGQALGQSNVRAWNADGQVFIVWDLSAQPAWTYRIHRGPANATSTSDASLLGQVFEPEWKGKRLQLAAPSATWRVPDGKGGTYTLSATEGLFVFTPHAEDAQATHFFVTRDDETQLSPQNRTLQSIAVTYDPVSQPVRCHTQLTGKTGKGFPFVVYAMWVDGRDDPWDARPDIPVMANRAKHGAPHVFAVFSPTGGLPQGPYPAVVCLHGGGTFGSYWSYAPNSVHYENTGNVPVDGITITFDDRLFVASNGMVNEDRPSNWFGWHQQMSATTAAPAPPNGLVVPYTLRRLVWTLDWLARSSPFSLDTTRVAIMGNSMGGTGTLLLSRWKPERFSAATAFVPPHYTPETGSRLFGTTQTNLRTTESGPDGDTLRVNDFFDPAVRLSPTQRDRCLTRIYRGRCDDAAEWGDQHIKLFQEMNEKGLGTHLYWDQRDHTASDWTTDTPGDACPDIGQWVSPVRTERCAAGYQTRFRSDRSYPGFFQDDQDLTAPGRQPDLGNGQLTDGAAWGTWSGYYDWDVETIMDTACRWECTMHLVGLSPVLVDNFPGTTSSCNVRILRPKAFLPQPGEELEWRLVLLSNGQVLQSGTVQPDTAGLVTVEGLQLFKDPVRTRLIVECPMASDTEDPLQAGMEAVLYPNPTTGQVSILGSHRREWTYVLAGPLGQLLTAGTSREGMIDVGRVPDGLYTMLLTDDLGNRTSHKLIIIK